jgi:hypothetical protein
MPTVAWTLLAALAFWALKNVKRAKHKTIKAVLVRAAAILFLVAGTISAGGVIGHGLHKLVHLTGQVGAGVVWVLWLVGALSWLAGMVPEKWFSGNVPDWLSVSGLALPSLLASVPGPVGHGMTVAMGAAHDTVGSGLGSLFSVKA